MKVIKIFSVFGMVLATVSAIAEEKEKERETFEKWRIGVGAAFNFGVSPSLRARNLPAPAIYSVAPFSTKKAAENRAAARKYDGDGYIAPDSLDNGFSTTNWKLPASSYQGDGHFTPGNAYEQVIDSTFGYPQRDASDDEDQFGISIEFSRELWIHDEREEHRWGVDFAAAFSYFFRRDIYSVQGSVVRTDTVKEGVIRTDIDDPDATFKYDNHEIEPDGMYGYGSAEWNPFAPALGLQGLNLRGNPYISDPYDVPDVPTRTESSACAYSASGDYRELEMLFMFRPWYEIKDWWRVFGEIGVGVSWGKFDSSFHGGGIAAEEDFAQWDCYGVAGLGTVFRYKSFDIMIDFLGRFWRDDFEVEGRYVDGYISRADWGLRLMIGYEF